MLYEPRYAEYYANVAWAQTLTLVHLFLAGTFLMAGIMQKVSSLMLLTGMLMCILISAYCLENMKNTLSKRTEECEAELPEVVSTMAVLVNAGIVLREAWHMVANNNDGAFYDLMRKASEDMRNGASDAEAISLFGTLSNSAEIRKFTSALLQSMEKGGAELSVFLANQSSELWNSKRQHMLQNGEKAATKLLLPIVLIFIGIIIIVMTAAFAGSLF
jgi:tight adherence protein C